MKTKLLNLFLLLVASIETMFASDTQVDGIWYDFDSHTKTATVTYRGSSYDSYENEYFSTIVIPSTVIYNNVEYIVTSIGEAAFDFCRNLTSVDIPNSITNIGEAAFAYCSSLVSITLSNSVTSIGDYAFFNCSSLTSPVYNEHVFAYMPTSFSGAYVIPDGIVSVAGSAFLNCNSLTSITIPNSTESIGADAFTGCTALTLVVWEAVNCSDFTHDNAPFNTKNIKPGSGTEITSLVFGDEVEHIPAYLCSNIVNVSSLNIPNSVTSIGDKAFYECSGLTSVTIGSNVESIGNGAFPYSNISKLSTINFTGTIYEWCQKSWSPTAISTNYELQLNGETQQTITIPVDVTSMRNDAFNGCKATSVVWNAKYCDLYSVASSSSSTSTSSTYYNPFGRDVNSFVFGEEVESIPGSLCFGMNISSIVIPNRVKVIGKSAFLNCSQLSSVTIGDSVSYILDDAFAGCRNLISVSIPNSTSWIGNNVFYECSRLQTVSLGDNIAKIGNCVFQNCTNLTSVSLPNSVTSLGGAVFAGCVNLESVHLSSNISDIYRETFSGCNKLASINLPNGITSIRDDAFSNCSSLTSVVIPNSVTSIGGYAFSGCTSLASVEIGKGVNKIGYNAFKGCSNLQTLTLGENIITYGSEAFSGCSALTSIYNYRKTPATLSADVFKNVDYFACTLYVLESSVDMYKSDRSSWKDFFYNIEPISAISTTTGNDIQVTPADNTANIVWPQVNGAETYELVIKDKSGNVICTLIFNANGQLASIAFNAPGRNNAPQQTQAAGFEFTVTGLNSGTSYDLIMTSKNSNGGTIQTKTISFTTTGEAQDIENIISENAQSSRILRDGQVFILRGEKVYTLQGQEVK